jgi:hypothetical protein
MSTVLIVSFVILIVLSAALTVIACMASAQVNRSEEWYEEPIRMRRTGGQTIPES